MLSFLLKAVVISLTGVMAPGPVTVATVAAGARRPHAGALIALGHGVIELPLILLILVGIGPLFEIDSVKIGIGILGGAFLAWMGVRILLDLRKNDPAGAADDARGPLATGIVLTGGNPYFLLWWATIGLALTTEAAELGAVAFAVFATVHWLCDLVWLEALSVASFMGSKLVGGRIFRVVLAVCAISLLVFAALFVYDAAAKLLAA